VEVVKIVKFLRHDLPVVYGEIQGVGPQVVLDFLTAFEPHYGAERQMEVVARLLPASTERFKTGRRCGLGYSAAAWARGLRKMEAVAEFLARTGEKRPLEEVILEVVEKGRPYRLANVTGLLDWIPAPRWYQLVSEEKEGFPLFLEAEGESFENSRIKKAVFPLRKGSYAYYFSAEHKVLAEIVEEAKPLKRPVRPLPWRFSDLEEEARRLFEEEK